jgi:DNA-binding GntR family transcriptional regulator
MYVFLGLSVVMSVCCYVCLSVCIYMYMMPMTCSCCLGVVQPWLDLLEAAETGDSEQAVQLLQTHPELLDHQIYEVLSFYI